MVTQERETLAQQLLYSEQGKRNVSERLAASQAREQQLREALEHVKHATATPNGCIDLDIIVDALSLPQDDTALRQWGAKLLREMASEFRKGDPAPKHWAVIALECKADELEGRK